MKIIYAAAMFTLLHTLVWFAANTQFISPEWKEHGQLRPCVANMLLVLSCVIFGVVTYYMKIMNEYAHKMNIVDVAEDNIIGCQFRFVILLLINENKTLYVEKI